MTDDPLSVFLVRMIGSVKNGRQRLTKYRCRFLKFNALMFSRVLRCFLGMPLKLPTHLPQLSPVSD